MTLIGATTENPYFEVNSASSPAARSSSSRALSEEELGRGRAPRRRRDRGHVDDEIVALIARRAGGDARTALATVELAWETARAEECRSSSGTSTTPPGSVRSATTRAPTSTTTSSPPSSSPCAAPIPTRRSTTSRRCSKGRGPALHRPPDDDLRLRGRGQCRSARSAGRGRGGARALEHVGLPEAQLNLAQAAIYLAGAPKSKASANAPSGRRARRCARAATCARPRCCSTPATRPRASSVAASGTSTRTSIRAARSSTTSRRNCGGALLSAFGQRRGGGRG